MNTLKIFQSCSNLISSQAQQIRNIRTASSPLLINFTKPLQAEPMKKKKKADPGLVLQKEAKKLKKLDKMVKKIELKGKILKPVDEIEGDRAMLKTKDLRRRAPVVLPEDELERRALLFKDWQRYKFVQYAAEERKTRKLLVLRKEALDELRKESEELYQQALQLDEKSIPLSRMGPMDTPPIKGYKPPDGECIDTTKTFMS